METFRGNEDAAVPCAEIVDRFIALEVSEPHHLLRNSLGTRERRDPRQDIPHNGHEEEREKEEGEAESKKGGGDAVSVHAQFSGVLCEHGGVWMSPCLLWAS